jgi:hypothetical protein
MNYTVYPTSTQLVEMNSIEIQRSLVTLIRRSKARLFARWEVVNNKLICKWQLAE